MRRLAEGSDRRGKIVRRKERGDRGTDDETFSFLLRTASVSSSSLY